MSTRSSFEENQEEITSTNNDLHVEDVSTPNTPKAQDEKAEAAKGTDETLLPDVQDRTASDLETADNDDFPVGDEKESSQPNDSDFDEFGEFDDEFVDAADNDDDDFGDFDDFEQAEESMESMTEELKEEEEPKTPTEAELYVSIIMLVHVDC